jgi:hypothetical protein
MLTLRCVVCHKPFDFTGGESAVVLRHIAYGYDFVHTQHESIALDWIFVDPEYDRPEFSHDASRARVLDVAPPAGWAAVVPEAPERIAKGYYVRFEPLRVWTLVEYRDGSRHLEGLLRDAEWESEPGGAEFPEGEGGLRDAVDYTAPTERSDPAWRARWEALVQARYRGEQAPPSRHLPLLRFNQRAACAARTG